MSRPPGYPPPRKRCSTSALRRLAAEGKSVLLVSHKLEDVEALCDRVTVLRLGRVTGSMARPFDTEGLLRMMFGTPPPTPARCAQPAGSAVLMLDRVSSPGGRSGLVDCSVAIRQGEVVGLAGLEGSGQDVFLRVAGGLKPPQAGSVHLSGQSMVEFIYHNFNRLGVFFLPSARLEEGLIPELTITEHVALQDERRAISGTLSRRLRKTPPSVSKSSASRATPEHRSKNSPAGTSSGSCCRFYRPIRACSCWKTPRAGWTWSR